MKQSRPEQRRHELIQSVIDVTENVLKSMGISAEHSLYAATAVADEIVNQFGGQNITFPTEYFRKLALRDADIFAQFNGDNLADIALRHGMTESGMRKLLSRAQIRARSNQHSLFPQK